MVAVLFALAIGIVVGSGFLGGPLLHRIQAEVSRVSHQNASLRSDRAQQDRLLGGYEQFAREAESTLVSGALAGKQVVVFTLEGSDGPTLDGITQSVQSAGGSVAATVTVLNKLALGDPADRARLADLLGSPRRGAEELRRDLGAKLGTRASAASAMSTIQRRPGPPPDQRVERMARGLEKAGFLSVARVDDATTVPLQAAFVIVAGSADQPLYPVQTFVKALAGGLSQHGSALVTAEPSTSAWGLVSSVCDDGAVADRVATVDQAERVPGQIATVLGLEESGRGRVGHYGTGTCSSEVFPSAATG